MKQPLPVVLAGRFVRLEPLEEQHRADLEAAAAEDPDALRYGALQLTLMGWDSWFGEAAAGVADGRYVAWATVALDTGRAVGSTRFGDIDVPSERVEIGWTWLAPSRWRTALNTEAKLLQLTYAFEELGAGRVALKTDGRNARSQAAIERLGGMKEGTLRRHLRMPDGFIRDTVYYSILADEWPPIRARLRERLYGASA
ncbi:MAG TPA: GNAT family protein [Candidatus Limnocylindria bacterium]|nr:GNAT family protein [Candidatus Limnocylindria bacterium]